ncbi:MAG: hypothetical protein ACD_3C00049G0003 [uncultured bacterium (gcode 4)]|uniref:Uncharacterized protein n=1 Tax=uncultured bacterium (gcode 4) TaxID=1234023 RepID=K2FBL7_9BACT|nr:MAG: hypothetical protein ACD_3C00049G0003 [uncultured bacterium (gcode 4)]
MQQSNIISYPHLSAQKASVTGMTVINPILTDFFWIDDAIKIQSLLQTKNPKEFIIELNSFFQRNPEKEWTFKEISEMLNEFINIVLSKTSDRKRKIVNIVEDILLIKGHDSNLIDMICQMKIYFDANVDREMKLTWKLISNLNLDTIDYL